MQINSLCSQSPNFLTVVAGKRRISITLLDKVNILIQYRAWVVKVSNHRLHDLTHHPQKRSAPIHAPYITPMPSAASCRATPGHPPRAPAQRPRRHRTAYVHGTSIAPPPDDARLHVIETVGADTGDGAGGGQFLSQRCVQARTLPAGQNCSQTPLDAPHTQAYLSLQSAGMVKRYHASFPSLSYGFNSRYPLQRSHQPPCRVVLRPAKVSCSRSPQTGFGTALLFCKTRSHCILSIIGGACRRHICWSPERPVRMPIPVFAKPRHGPPATCAFVGASCKTPMTQEAEICGRPECQTRQTCPRIHGIGA